MQLINTGFIINKFFVKAKAKNIAVIGVREHPAMKAPIPAKMYVLGACPVAISTQLPIISPIDPPKVCLLYTSPSPRD